MPRQTKIVATLGPASSSTAMLARQIAAGVDVVRLKLLGIDEAHLEPVHTTVRVGGVLSNNQGISEPGHRSRLRLISQGMHGCCAQATRPQSH
jgi:pyruvate kinase